jgi:hypothetical protein
MNIANEKKRDAEVGLESLRKREAVRMVLPDGAERSSVKYLKTTADIRKLTAEYGDLKAVGEAIIAGDPETDIEIVGRYLPRTHRLYLTADGDIAYRVRLEQVLYHPDGSERLRRDAAKAPANVAAETPITWSGRRFPKSQAIRKFVFGRKYQLRHTNGLTYDFLYDMAKQLHESDSMMLIGAGAKGVEPLVLTTGGEPYRAFLEGRIEGDSYCLILHLSNMELKPLPKESES